MNLPSLTDALHISLIFFDFGGMGRFPEASRTISSCTEERGKQWPFVKAENPPVRQVLAASLAPVGQEVPDPEMGTGQ